MIKDTSQLVALVLGLGLVGNSFYTLKLLADKDSSGIERIASNLPSTDFSSFSIRSDTTKDGHSWAISQRQHSPKTLLEFKDVEEEKPTFNGKIKKINSHMHKETVAYAYRPIIEEGSKGLTAKEQRCLELGLTGKANGKMVGAGLGTYGSNFFYMLPVIGPVAASLFFSEATRAVGNVGSNVSQQWNNC
tara:strand:+ start:477 stop:1046 length:570 start_codon:yes stop_codon:yes gene_type:complete